jgi:hypothetical protein
MDSSDLAVLASQSLIPNNGTHIEINIPPAQNTVGAESTYKIYQRVKAGDQITAKSTLSEVCGRFDRHFSAFSGLFQDS